MLLGGAFLPLQMKENRVLLTLLEPLDSAVPEADTPVNILVIKGNEFTFLLVSLSWVSVTYN